MNIFKKKQAEVPATNPFRALMDLRLFNGHRGIPPNVVVPPIPVLKDVIFPNVLITDMWEKQQVGKGIRDLAKALGGDYFSICPLDALESVYQLEIGPNHKQAYKNLYNIHCVNYRDMDREVMADIVNQINIFFTAKSHHPGANALQEPTPIIELLK